MDSSAVQEVANQLGIAADKVYEFAPEYGQMMVGSGLVRIALVSIALALFITLWVIAYNKQDYFSHTIWDGLGVIFAILAIASGIALVICLVGVGDIWAWANYPEAMMAKMVISGIG